MIRRSGNFGFVDNGAGELYTFRIGASYGGWQPTSMMLRGGYGLGANYISVNGVNIIPYGPDNDMPGYVRRLLEKFYAGEGIMGKKAGLQWGEGPRLYRESVDANNVAYRAWEVDNEILKALNDIDWITQMHRCLIDLVHLEGFWVKITRTRGSRLGRGRIAAVEHMPAGKVRFVWPGDVESAPTHAMVADFPFADPRYQHVYPLFDPKQPLLHPVSLAYYNIYSFNHDYYSVPRFVGAFDWIELAGTLANILAAYNENASAISMHIESPQSYWDKAEERIQDVCRQTGQKYSPRMLEEFKDEAMEKFASSMTGRQNAGKFMHTSQFWDAEAEAFVGWKIVPIDKKIKDYIEAQVAICRKAEAAATSGFGLDPALSNLILDTKLGSGSEKLYSLKVYNASETAVPDMVLCKPWQQFIETNFPGSGLRVGLYRSIVDAEKNINPENRVKSNV